MKCAAIISSPSVANGIVTFGGRDGFLYALDLATGKQKWAYDHKISWVLSTPAIDEGKVFAGSSDGHFFQSVDQSTGVQQWRFTAGAPIWSSAAIAGPMIYFGVNDGHLFAVDKHTGVEKWRYKSPDKIFGSPIVADGMVYYGCDDGNLYVLAGTTIPDPKPPSTRRVVFWESIPGSVEKWFTDGTDEWIRNYFVREGYELVDSKGLENVMSEHLVTKSPSVIVFADNRVPQALVADESENSLIRKYLNGGGKIVWLGPDPIAWKRDSTGKLLNINYTRSQKLLGIRFPGVQLEGIGWYTSRVTEEGKKWGLRGWWVSLGCVDPKEISKVLALDEHGMAGAWVKNYGGPEGSGLVQLFIPSNRRVDLFSVKLAAEYGLQ